MVSDFIQSKFKEIGNLIINDGFDFEFEVSNTDSVYIRPYFPAEYKKIFFKEWIRISEHKNPRFKDWQSIEPQKENCEKAWRYIKRKFMKRYGFLLKVNDK